MNCSATDCLNEAKWRPRLVVPATGYPLEEGNDSTITGHFANLAVCDDHREGPAHYLTEAGKIRFTSALAENLGPGVVPPDFERAEIRYSGVG